MNKRFKLDEGLCTSLHKYVTEELFEADEADTDDGWDIINPEDEVKLIAQDPNYELYQILGRTGFMMMAEGTKWLMSYDYNSNSYVDSDVDNHWRLQRNAPENFFVILDKHNPKKRYLITYGDAQIISPSGAYYPAATWLEKHCEQSIWEYFIKNRFPYLTANLDKKVGAKQFKNKKVYKYPEDKEMTWQNKGGSSITKIEIAQGTKSINSRAFGNLKLVQEVTIPNTVKKLGKYLFVSCDGLKKVNLPNTLKEIPAGCFNSCKSLEEITIPEGVEKIGSYAFCWCESLKKIHLPSTLKIIDDEAFYGCPQLETLILPEGLEEIGYMAFLHCDLKHIFIPASVQKVGEKAFMKNDNIHIDVELSGTDAQHRWGMGWLIKNTEWNRNTYVTSNTYFEPRTTITFNANREAIKEDIEQGNLLDDEGGFDVISAPNPVFEKDEWEVFQPLSLEDLYTLSVGTDWGLDELIGDGENSYTNYELKQKIEQDKNLQLYVIHDKTTDEKFLYTPSKNFQLKNHYGFLFDPEGKDWRPADDQRWRYYRFSSQQLDAFLREKNNRGLSRWAARKWTGLSGLKMELNALDLVEENNYTITYGSELYETCKGSSWDAFSIFLKKYFKYVRFPRNIKTIHDYAFYEFKGLEEIVVPNTIKEIEDGAFCFCENATKITLPEGLEKIGDAAFNGCSSLKSIVIPKSVTHIGADAFRYDTDITIYCEAESQPEGWDKNWNIAHSGNDEDRIKNIIWGYKE